MSCSDEAVYKCDVLSHPDPQRLGEESFEIAFPRA
jgi:hypothetical protein